MSEDMIKSVKVLLVLGNGDPSRLREILNTLQKQTPLYFSDYKYVEDLLSQRASTLDQPKSKDGPKKIKKIVNTKQKVPQKRPVSQALSILKARLASGEISLDEFQSLKKILEEN